MNSDTCQHNFSSNDKKKKTEITGEVSSNTQVQKLLGVHIDYKLKFDTHIETIWKKVGKSFMPLHEL